jgi:hypothetical protein
VKEVTGSLSKKASENSQKAEAGALG